MHKNKSKKAVWPVLTFILLVITLLFIIGGSEKIVREPPAVQTTASPAKINNTNLYSSTASKQVGESAEAPVSVPFSRILPTASINDLIVDPSGCVWAATETGVTSVHDDRFEYYSFENGNFPSRQAQCLAHDGTTLRVGTMSGLVTLAKNGSFVFDAVTDALPSKLVWSLFWDGLNLWIGTQNGLVSKTGNMPVILFNSSNTNNGLRHNWCLDIKKADGWLTIAHEKGISIWNPTQNAANPNWWRNIDASSLGIVRPVSSAAYDGSNLWWGTPAGLVKLNTSLNQLLSNSMPQLVCYTKLHGLPSDRVNDVFFHKGVLWIATNKGLARMKGGRIRAVVPVSGEEPGKIQALYASGDLLWLGRSDGIQFINTAMIE